MPYNNSAGNSSIANEYGQWRYFSAAKEKLGVYKGTPINISSSGVVPEQYNWLAAAAKGAEAAMGLYESYRDFEYKRAEEYLNTHSLEDYKKQVSKGEVPFQYDYLAMTRLKQGWGEVVFKVAAQDFQNDVDRNKYAGQSPEVVDAAFYKHLQESVKEFDDGSLGFSTDDPEFNKGLYADAGRTRLAMLVEHSKAEDKFLQQQFKQQQIAKIQDLANDPNKTDEELIGGVKDILNTTYRSSPEDQSAYLGTLLKGLSSNPRGAHILNTIGDIEVSKGVTLREFMGEDAYQTALVNANSFRFNTDAKYRMEFENSIDRLAEAGNVSLLTQKLNQHIQANGNVQDSEYRLLMRAVDTARGVQRAQLRAAQSNALQLEAMNEARQYIRDVDAGKTDKTFEQFKFEIDQKYGSGAISSNTYNVLQQEVANEILGSDDKGAISKLLNVATRDSTPTGTRTYLKNYIKNGMQTVNNYIAQSSTTGVYVDDPQQREEAFTALQRINSLYLTNPTAVMNSLESSDVRNVRDTFLRLDAYAKAGVDPFKAEAKRSILEQKMREEATRKGVQYKPFTVNMDEFNEYSTNIAQGLRNNQQLKAYTEVKAMDLLAADPSMKIGDALDAALDQVKNEYTALTPFKDDSDYSIAVPKNLIKSFSKDPYINTVNDDVYNNYVNKALQDIITSKGTGITSVKDVSSSYVSFDSYGNQVINIVDNLGNKRGTIPIAAIANRVDKNIKKSFYSKEAIEANVGLHRLAEEPLINPAYSGNANAAFQVYTQEQLRKSREETKKQQ